MPDYFLPESAWPATLPDLHRAHLRAVILHFRHDPDLCGLAAGGSFISGRMDGHSDLDLVVVAEPGAWPALLTRRQPLVATIAPVLSAFTGEHVHESRLLIVLHGPPALHVDYKFVALDQAPDRVEDPVILWERNGALSRAFATRPAVYPLPEPQWIEDRFWVWVHYLTAKAARRELFEVLDGLAFFRKRVFGPWLLARTPYQPSGVRRLEEARPDALPQLARLISSHSLAEALRAVHAAITLYRDLRPQEGPALHYRRGAEDAALAYLEEVERNQT